jgi:hypothetical protein
VESVTTAEQALTMTCPECGAAPGVMCTTIAPTHVEGDWNKAGYSDKSQIGRTAKRPHNGRGRAYYHAHLPEPERELTWMGRTRSFRSRDHRYQIEQDWTDAGAFLDQSDRHQIYRAYVRIYGGPRIWFDLGWFRTLDEAKAACQKENAARGFKVCSCGLDDGHRPACQLA